MRSFSAIILFSIVSILLTDCGKCTSEANSNQLQPTSPNVDIFEKRIVVLVDVSSSFSLESAKAAAQNVAEIVNNLADGSELLIFAAEEKTFDTPIFQIKKVEPLDHIAKEVFTHQIWPKQSAAAGNAVFQAWKKKLNKSCLLKGLKSVYNALNGSSKAKETYLLVLSDMLECCDLGCPSTLEGFETMEKKLSVTNLKSHPLASKVPLNNIQIGIINKDATEANSALMDSEAFDSFWKKAFQEMGYGERPLKSQDIGSFLEKIK